MLRCPTGAARVEGPLAPCYRCKARLANGSSLSPPSPLSHSLLVHRSPLPIDRILTPIHLLPSPPAPFRTIPRSFWCPVHTASLLQSFLLCSSCFYRSPPSLLLRPLSLRRTFDAQFCYLVSKFVGQCGPVSFGIWRRIGDCVQSACED